MSSTDIFPPQIKEYTQFFKNTVESYKNKIPEGCKITFY